MSINQSPKMKGGGGGGDQLERYEKLGIGESLPRVYQYPIACQELSSILRGAYSQLPKNLQSLVFQHTLTAFRLLPQMQTQKAISAANLLIQSAEAVLPKQRRVLAATEFRHAKIAHKRRCKDRQEGSTHLPQDVLVHIFGFLDLQSLLCAASVCWLWNSAASDNYLWHLQHVSYFGDSSDCLKGRALQRCEMLENDEHMRLQEEVTTETSIDWREAFIKAYKGNSFKTHTSYRGFCGRCHTVVWLSKMKCYNQQCRLNSKKQQITPISTEQIVEYILDGAVCEVSSSESDTDSDEETTSKLWAYPRHLSGYKK
ncbi:F-box protein At5g52880 [Rhododendron vialii]|uniref:F-box protein At5g52880 n=1 Tax=Rhododendron vialii TaxID=182163 RepID=UPI00265D9513|nr:F-box protein At5g52880 [Rhododendron vialii]